MIVLLLIEEKMATNSIDLPEIASEIKVVNLICIFFN